MRLGSSVALASGLLVALAAGCSGETTGTSTGGTGGLGTMGGTGGNSMGSGGGTSTVEIDAAIGRLNALIAAYCDCLGSAAERDACLLAASNEALVVNDCQRAVLATSEGQGMVDCVGAVIDDVDTCMDSAGCDQTAIEICFASFDTRMGACDSANAAVATQLEACDTGSSTGNDFTCDDGYTIPMSWVCDWDDDCTGGEDEVGCTDFVCNDGDEIPQSWVCDGFADCTGGEDEAGC